MHKAPAPRPETSALRPIERPTIGFTRPASGGLINRIAVHLAIRAAGGRPRRLTPNTPIDIDTLDGLVLTGGADIDPRHYGEQVAAPMTLDPDRDALELRLAREAYDQRLPTIGICRGMQVMTVALGGRLLQDVEPQAEAHMSPLPLWRADIDSTARLADVLRSPSVRINRIHHQAVDEPGDSLRVVARGADGLVQGVEAPDRALFVGVQWHPEYLPYLAAHRRIFRALLDAAAQPAVAPKTTARESRPSAIAGRSPIEGVGR